MKLTNEDIAVTLESHNSMLVDKPLSVWGFKVTIVANEENDVEVVNTPDIRHMYGFHLPPESFEQIVEDIKTNLKSLYEIKYIGKELETQLIIHKEKWGIEVYRYLLPYGSEDDELLTDTIETQEDTFVG